MYLLDTNICIYIIKSRPGSVLKAMKRKSGKDMFISTISVAELQYGVEKSMHPARNRMALLEFLSRFRILGFNDRDAVEYGRIRASLEKSGSCIGPLDLLICSQAVSRELILVTNNQRKFERIRALRIENWARER